MKENKNIEQFFKDKFENHEINPPEEIWNNIEEKLQKKKKRRVIPFWWYGSGVAALFVIGLFVFNNNYTLEIHPKNEIVIDENSNKKTTIDNQNGLKNKNDIQNTVIVSSENKVDTDKNESKEKINVNTNILNIKNKNVGQNDNYSIVNSEKTKTNTNTIIKKEHLVNHTKKSTQNSTSLVVNNTISTDKNDDLDHKLKGTEIENKLVEKQENIVQNNSELNQSKSESNNENNIDLGKIAMKNQDNVATKGEVNTFKDSTAIATVEPNELEELLKEKEEQIAQEQKMNRWQVTPNLAPIYFGSFDNGSPLDSNLDDNTKSFNNNISYGVAVNYSVNKKVKIRTGVNSFTVDYNTNDIVFFQNSNARMMTNVDPTIEGSFIEVIPIKNLITAFNRLETEQNTGILNQRMGYIEMPMEISYKLFDKKFGVEVIGGMSTLFLSKNEVFLETDGMSMKIGEASNLNPVHFSTNIGVGFNYGFLKNFQARIEPTFKYQLNTFSRDSQNFKPYIFGIYTGISYNF